MNRKIFVGVVLVVLGAAGMAVREIPYTVENESVDLGIFRGKITTEKHSPLPLIAGVGLVVAGLTLIVAGGRKP